MSEGRTGKERGKNRKGTKEGPERNEGRTGKERGRNGKEKIEGMEKEKKVKVNG